MASLFRLLGRHARQPGVQDIQDRRGLENGLERLFFGLERLFFSFSRLAKKGRRMECTFACFDFARFDFFLLMIVLNQSPDPMASTGLHHRDQFVFRSACLDHKENEGE
jgi:hypothetical protein